MTTINDLPLELLHLMLGHLTQAKDEDTDALLAASLVARHWRAPAQAALWDAVRVGTIEQVESILESPALRCHRTRHLTVENYAIASTSAKELLASMVGLEVLDVDDSHEQAEEMIAGSFLDESWVFRGHLRDPVISPSTNATATPAFTLSYLFLCCLAPSRQVIRSILTSSASTLTALHLDYVREDTYAALIDSFPLLGSTLTSLTLRTETDYDPADDFLPSLAFLTALTSFCISSDEMRIIDMALEYLPSPIGVLEVTLESHSRSAAAADLLARMDGEAWNGLRVLDVHLSREGILKMKDGPELLQKCAEQGIKVRVEWLDGRGYKSDE